MNKAIDDPYGYLHFIPSYSSWGYTNNLNSNYTIAEQKKSELRINLDELESALQDLLLLLLDIKGAIH